MKKIIVITLLLLALAATAFAGLKFYGQENVKVEGQEAGKVYGQEFSSGFSGWSNYTTIPADYWEGGTDHFTIGSGSVEQASVAGAIFGNYTFDADAVKLSFKFTGEAQTAFVGFQNETSYPYRSEFGHRGSASGHWEPNLSFRFGSGDNLRTNINSTYVYDGSRNLDVWYTAKLIRYRSNASCEAWVNGTLMASASCKGLSGNLWLWVGSSDYTPVNLQVDNITIATE
jgi:hypothetical protein